VTPEPAEVEPVGPAEPEVSAAPEPEPVEKIIDTEYVGGVPPEGRGGGVWYRLKWGDTLWNLSVSFYRTPWLYGLIAVENDIKNPDVIYAGTDIFIPEN
jgi:nucleoid-associated protein YgaU